jgi:hypothetical protein
MILKPFSLLTGAIAAGALLSVGAKASLAQVESNYVCFAIDGSGQVINLEPLCAAPPPQETAAQPGATDPNAVPEDAYQAFLNAFNTSASPESLTIADLIGQETVLSLGASMCEFLAAGASPADLEVAFSQTTLPPVFLQDVGNAAAPTLCAGSLQTL